MWEDDFFTVEEHYKLEVYAPAVPEPMTESCDDLDLLLMEAESICAGIENPQILVWDQWAESLIILPK